jgi:hypothetical protein
MQIILNNKKDKLFIKYTCKIKFSHRQEFIKCTFFFRKFTFNTPSKKLLKNVPWEKKGFHQKGEHKIWETVKTEDMSQDKNCGAARTKLQKLPKFPKRMT